MGHSNDPSTKENPMKTATDEAIALLENDHQEVQQMFKEFEELSDRSKVSKKRLADQICQALTIHTELEEKIFYPAVRSAIKDDDLMDEALVEHAGAKDLIAQIMAIDPGDELYDAKVKVLSEQVIHHIQEEEREMFPQVRRSKLDLNALGEELAQMKAQLSEQE
jgi:hemerythrin superfamily protein